MLFHHDSSAAPQSEQTASPVCGSKDFSSVRLYSALQFGQLSPSQEYAPRGARQPQLSRAMRNRRRNTEMFLCRKDDATWEPKGTRKPKKAGWSFKEERRVLELAAQSKSPEEIANLISRSPEAIRRVAIRLGATLKKDKATVHPQANG